MVQRPISDTGLCRPTMVPSKNVIDPCNDDSNRPQRNSVPEGAPNAMSMAFMEHYNIQAYWFRLDSGEEYEVTRSHLEPQEVHLEDRLTRRLSRSSVDVVEDSNQEEFASKSGQARGLPSASRHLHSRTSKRKRKESSSPTLEARRRRNLIKTRRAATMSGYNSDSEDEDEVDELEGGETETQPMRIVDLHLLYYNIAFRSMNQLACKDIGKTWIRICHPRKQTTHPYNGGRKDGRFGSERSLADYEYLGHFSMPDYWPSDEGWKDQKRKACRHKEPDHVKKHERLTLLVHLLRSQHKGFVDGDFSLGNLRRSTDSVHLEHEKNWPTESVERLREIYRMREQEIKFEQGGIDGDTLVYVQMPKPRCKGRKAPKAKAASPPGEQVKKESEETISTTCNAPIANMRITLQIQDDEMDATEGSEPSILADTSSSTEEVAPDASCPEPTLCEARTIQHGLPFFGSPSPGDRHYNSAQESWTRQSKSLGQDPTVFTHPNPFGTVATLSVGQRSLPLHDQYRFGSSSMQSFPSQEFVRRQYDHESTACQRVANGMRPDRTFTHGPSARPVAPKMENIHDPTFAASSSGLVGAFPTDIDYSSCDDLWRAQMEPSMYTAIADPNVSLLPSTNGSFSSGYSDESFSSGLQLDTWNGGNQNLMLQYHHDLNEDLQRCLNLQAVSIPQCQPASANAPSCGNPDPANRSFSTAVFRNHPQV